MTREQLAAYLRRRAKAPGAGPLVSGAYGEAVEMVDADEPIGENDND
jgi:hypothetical protein